MEMTSPSTMLMVISNPGPEVHRSRTNPRERAVRGTLCPCQLGSDDEPINARR